MRFKTPKTPKGFHGIITTKRKMRHETQAGQAGRPASSQQPVALGVNVLPDADLSLVIYKRQRKFRRLRQRLGWGHKGNFCHLTGQTFDNCHTIVWQRSRHIRIPIRSRIRILIHPPTVCSVVGVIKEKFSLFAV